MANNQKPRASVVKRANNTQKSAQSQKSGSKVSKMFGAVGGYKGVPRKQAKQLVNGTIKPEIQAMKRDRKYINRTANDAVSDTNSLYNRSVGDLSYVYDEAGSYMDHMGQQINQGYNDTAAKVGAIDSGINTGIQQNTSAAAQAIKAELERLGIGGQTGVGSGLQADSAFAQNQVTQQAGFNQANIAASQQAAGTVSSLLGGMVAGSRASHLGQAANTRQADVADIGRTKRDDLSTVLDSMMELKKSRPAMIRDMLMQLQAQGFSQWQAIQALNMDRKSLNHSMAMDRAGMAEDGSYYNTLAGAYGAQAGQNPYGSPSGTGPNNGSPNNPGAGYTDGAAPTKKGPRSKPRAGGGSRNDEFYGPLAGGYS